MHGCFRMCGVVRCFPREIDMRGEKERMGDILLRYLNIPILIETNDIWADEFSLCPCC
jgi:hypothetical protein